MNDKNDPQENFNNVKNIPGISVAENGSLITINCSPGH